MNANPRWKTISEMANELGLSASPTDHEGLKHELRLKIANHHSDLDPENTEFHALLNAAWEMVENMTNSTNALAVSYQDLPTFMRAQTQALAVIAEKSTQAASENQREFERRDFRDSARLEVSRNLQLPKIGSGTICSLHHSFGPLPAASKIIPYLG
jgi:hypothetical protein